MTTASATTLLTVLKENEYSALEYVNMSVSDVCENSSINNKDDLNSLETKIKKLNHLDTVIYIFV